MAYDFKKEFKEYYAPKEKPQIVKIPKMNFLAVKGKGSPAEVNGEYTKAIEMLYPVAYTLRMSYKSSYKIKGYFEYVVPPLEGFWWQEGIKGYDKSKKDLFSWISLIRLPDFISLEDFNWAVETASKKLNKDFSKIEFLSLEEGLVVQMLHVGSFDDEYKTTKIMDEFIEKEGYVLDFNDERRHHELYLSDFRKVEMSKLRTILRHPIKKK